MVVLASCLAVWRMRVLIALMILVRSVAAPGNRWSRWDSRASMMLVGRDARRFLGGGVEV